MGFTLQNSWPACNLYGEIWGLLHPIVAMQHSRLVKVSFMPLSSHQPGFYVLCRLFYSLAIPLLLASIVYGLRYMPSRATSLSVKLDVGLAWAAAISTLVLVPTDVATAFQVRWTALPGAAVHTVWPAQAFRHTTQWGAMT